MRYLYVQDQVYNLALDRVKKLDKRVRVVVN